MAEPVFATLRSGLRADISVRAHQIITDEPVAAYGSDQGPTAYELLLAALAGCTAVTAKMYADRKQWPLDRVDVRVRHHRVDEPDPARPDHGPVRTDIFDLEVEFHGDLDEAQRDRLLAIAGRCPVKRALQGPTRINTVAVPPGSARVA